MNIEERRWISVADAAVYLGLSKKHLYQLAARRILPSAKLRGIGVRFDRRALDKMLEANAEMREIQ